MKINEKIKKCVAFLQYKMADGSFKYAGTCFFIFRDAQVNKYLYAVTAKHVIDRIKKIGLGDIFIRLNLKTSGTTTFCTKANNWFYHPDDNIDVAIIPFKFPSENIDHMYYPESSFLNSSHIDSNEINEGDEVFITGLFSYHNGNNKNLPIVRIGNIAMMDLSEKVQTGDILREAYLIESRSIGGLSGSPVFINLGSIRLLGGEIKHAVGEHIPLLLGLIYGHFDSQENNIDYIEKDVSDSKKVNVGIAIVTPIFKLVETLQHFEKIKVSFKK